MYFPDNFKRYNKFILSQQITNELKCTFVKNKQIYVTLILIKLWKTFGNTLLH